MTKTDNKWKSRLLSSSLPLEYEVAKVLTDLNFSVSFDYPYHRQDGKHEREFSTDINGLFFFPCGTDNQIDASLNLVAECKYRDENKKWVFLPDVNKPDISDFTLGYTIKSLSEFSTIKKRNHDLIYSFEENIDFALKGVELNIEKGDVFDKDIKHGISQLKYLLPYLIKNSIENNVFCHLDDAKPVYLVSILVTNADLYVLNDNFSIKTVKEANELNEIAEKVPYLICHSELGPDFIEHHTKIYGDFLSKIKQERGNLKEFENFQENNKTSYGFYYSPVETCFELEKSYYHKLLTYYSQHFICSFEHFPNLIKQILKLLSNVTEI